MPALFFRLALDAVRVDKATFVLEHQRREFKRNSIMFPPVPEGSSLHPIRNASRIYIVYYTVMSRDRHRHFRPSLKVGWKSSPARSSITLSPVCDHTKELRPVFPGRTKHLHWSFGDPAAVQGSDEEQRAAFRATRDDLQGLGCSHARHRICTQSKSESVKPVNLFSPGSLVDRHEVVGPVRPSPMIDIYTTDGVVARHTALCVGNLLTATLKLFRQMEDCILHLSEWFWLQLSTILQA